MPRESRAERDARVLNRAAEGGAFDDLVGSPALNYDEWKSVYEEAIADRAVALLGDSASSDIRFWRGVGRGRRIHFGARF